MRCLWLALLMLCACQPLPRPFGEDRPPPRAPILSPRDSAGIAVAPVAGAPDVMAKELAEAMAGALREAEIPASTHGGNKGSFVLKAVAREDAVGTDRSRIVVDWQLADAAGRILGHTSASSDQPSAAWRAGSGAIAAALVAAAAPAVAKLIQEDPPRAAKGVDPVIAIHAIAGAPGDGGRTLVRAMGEALRRAHIAVADKPADEETLVLAGTVVMSRPRDGKQRVQVSWALLRPDGSQLGQIDQENEVAAGSLDGVWGDVAYAVASAAVPGIAALIRRAQEAETGS